MNIEIPGLRVLQPNDLTQIEVDGVKLSRVDLTDRKRAHCVCCTMHRTENGNSLEVLKFALWCRKNGVHLTMFGAMNQLPIFSVFADACLLAESPRYLEHAYSDIDNSTHYTTYNPPAIPPSLNVIDLDRMAEVSGEREERTVMGTAMKEITDEEVIQAFSKIVVSVRKSSLDLFARKVVGLIPRNTIVCELKEHDLCGGRELREKLRIFEAKSEIRMLTGRSFIRDLCNLCGDHYMAVQCIGSIYENWSWFCNGGSANIFAFFPFKTVVMRDVFVPHELTRWLSMSRFGCGLFPMFSPEEFLSMDFQTVERLRKFVGQ